MINKLKNNFILRESLFFLSLVIPAFFLDLFYFLYVFFKYDEVILTIIDFKKQFNYAIAIFIPLFLIDFLFYLSKRIAEKQISESKVTKDNLYKKISKEINKK